MMKYLAFGLMAALLLDATVVRMFLVPSVMKLLGDDCWWAPRWARRLQNRLGLGEIDLPDEHKRPSVNGRPARPPVKAASLAAAPRPPHDPTHPGPLAPRPAELPSGASTTRLNTRPSQPTEASTTRLSVPGHPEGPPPPPPPAPTRAVPVPSEPRATRPTPPPPCRSCGPRPTTPRRPPRRSTPTPRPIRAITATRRARAAAVAAAASVPRTLLRREGRL